MGKLGEFESQEAMSGRMRGILENTQETLRRELGRKTKSFCWPWGSFCEEARTQGLAAGFGAFFTTREGVNRPGSSLAVHRFKVKDKPKDRYKVKDKHNMDKDKHKDRLNTDKDKPKDKHNMDKKTWMILTSTE